MSPRALPAAAESPDADRASGRNRPQTSQRSKRPCADGVQVVVGEPAVAMGRVPAGHEEPLEPAGNRMAAASRCRLASVRVGHPDQVTANSMYASPTSIGL